MDRYLIPIPIYCCCTMYYLPIRILQYCLVCYVSRYILCVPYVIDIFLPDDDDAMIYFVGIQRMLYFHVVEVQQIYFKDIYHHNIECATVHTYL